MVNKVVMGKWYKGCVVMLGDVVWCLMFYLGMGVMFVMKGVVELVDVIVSNLGDIFCVLVKWEVVMCFFICKYCIVMLMKVEVFVFFFGFCLCLCYYFMCMGICSLLRCCRKVKLVEGVVR